MKRIAFVAAVTVVVGLAAAGTIPALAQAQATRSEVSCPYHDSSVMPPGEMSGWMGSDEHAECMSSPEHGQMHAGMAGSQNMMGAGNMMGGADR